MTGSREAAVGKQRVMTVLHVRADNNIYGAERVILTLAKEQRR
jgi:hypothetical protein